MELASWLVGVGWIIGLVIWCREDARLNRRPLPTMSLWLILLFWPIAVPVCVLRIYGFGYGTLLVALHALIYLAANFLATVLSTTT